jgi:hypothetical protein
LRIPISVLSSGPFNAMSAALGFDPTQLRLRRVYAAGARKGASLLWHTQPNGVATIALASADPIRSDGTVLVAELERIVPGGRAKSVRILSARVDEH